MVGGWMLASVVGFALAATGDVADGLYPSLEVRLPGRFSATRAGSGDGPYDERPIHRVYWDYSVYAGRSELTQVQRRELVEWWNVGGWRQPGYPEGVRVEAAVLAMTRFPDCGMACPADSMSWYDAVFYANVLSRLEGRDECYALERAYTGDPVAVRWPAGSGCTGWRLPTEAEWEHLAGQGRQRYGAPGSPEEVAWYADNSGGTPHPVCTAPVPENALGLCDMSGNLWEWVWDAYGPYPSGRHPGWIGGWVEGVSRYRVLRGGAWSVSADNLRSARRNGYVPGVREDRYGVRLVRTVGLR